MPSVVHAMPAKAREVLFTLPPKINFEVAVRFRDACIFYLLIKHDNECHDSQSYVNPMLSHNPILELDMINSSMRNFLPWRLEDETSVPYIAGVGGTRV